MRMEQSFEIAAPLERVWEALIDIERVAPCLPGAAITERDEEGAYHGSFQVKIGPALAAYNGTVRLGEIDAGVHTATLHARGTDKRGQGGATATVVNRLEAIDSGTRVHALTDMTITGKLARFGRGGMMEDISNRLLRDFAACLQARLTAEDPSPEPEEVSGEAVRAGVAKPAEHHRLLEPGTPIRGIELVLGVLVDRVKRLVGAVRSRLP